MQIQDWRAGRLAREGCLWAWYSTVLVVSAFALLVWGGPHESFDHVNYIEFFADPFAMHFEPLYTAVAFLFAKFVPESARFGASFFLFAVVPTLLLWHVSRPSDWACSPQFAYAMILTKSIFVGYISQRFFFVELWLTLLMAYAWSRPVSFYFGVIVAAGVHFSAVVAAPVYFVLRRGVRNFDVIVAAAIIVLVALYVRDVAGYKILSYDYSRYVDVGEDRGFPIFSLATLAVVALLAYVVAERGVTGAVLQISLVLAILKILFLELDVFSRIFQLAVDLMLIAVAARARASRLALLPALVAVAFALSQMFGVARSEEMRGYWIDAAENSLSSLLGVR